MLSTTKSLQNINATIAITKCQRRLHLAIAITTSCIFRLIFLREKKKEAKNTHLERIRLRLTYMYKYRREENTQNKRNKFIF